MTTKKTEAKKTAAASETTKAVAQPAAKAAKPEKAAKKTKLPTKVKIMRASFTMPKTDYQKIAEIKDACLKAGLNVKKSEVLRAGLKALGDMNMEQLARAMAGMGKAGK